MAQTLIIRGGAIGDFILTLPLFEAVRARDPAAEIDILGYAGTAELAVGRRHAQRMRRVDAPEWAPLFARDGELADAERAYLRGFGRVIVVWPDGDGVLHANLRRAGLRDALLLDPMPPADGALHAVDFLAAQCGQAGLPMPHVEPHLYPSERDRWWAERFMRVSTVGERPILGIAPGSGSARKNWPAAGYVEVARYWIGRRGNVLVFGGPADEHAISAVREGLGDAQTFYFCNEPLPRVAAALERCDAFVGNDSGITHMAAAVRTPTVALFGPTNPDHWRPRAPRVRVLRASPPQSLSDLEASRVIQELAAL